MAAESEAEILKPASPWNLHGTEQSCVLSRAFGSASNPVGLNFERFAPGKFFRLSFTGKRLGRFWRPSNFSITYSPGEFTHEPPKVQFGETADGVDAILITNAAMANWPVGEMPSGFCFAKVGSKCNASCLEAASQDAAYIGHRIAWKTIRRFTQLHG